MVMEHLYGPDRIRKFLKFQLDRYLRSRGGEVIEDCRSNGSRTSRTSITRRARS